MDLIINLVKAAASWRRLPYEEKIGEAWQRWILSIVEKKSQAKWMRSSPEN